MLIRACDIDKKFPAKKYTLTAEDGRTISKDLCEEHAEPFEEWLEEVELSEEEAEPAAEPEPEPQPARKAPARKATAKKAAATARKRPKIMTLEEIEAQKKG
ncbi:hypothetical protein [Streptomyces werraensis]|uniref:hypothetical protein n=1 Tax=Streptomyces werraensis TaxID=68284 RepID=UPI003811BACA